jgi:hypothetical protein
MPPGRSRSAADRSCARPADPAGHLRSDERLRPASPDGIPDGGPATHSTAWSPSRRRRPQLESFADLYRSDGIDLPFRATPKDGTLRVERLKAAPAALEPLTNDTFRAQFGIVRFTRDGTGAVTGLTIEAGRIRGLKFWKEQAVTRPSTSQRSRTR